MTEVARRAASHGFAARRASVRKLASENKERQLWVGRFGLERRPGRRVSYPDLCPSPQEDGLDGLSGLSKAARRIHRRHPVGCRHGRDAPARLGVPAVRATRRDRTTGVAAVQEPSEGRALASIPQPSRRPAPRGEDGNSPGVHGQLAHADCGSGDDRDPRGCVDGYLRHEGSHAAAAVGARTGGRDDSGTRVTACQPGANGFGVHRHAGMASRPPGGAGANALC